MVHCHFRHFKQSRQYFYSITFQLPVLSDPLRSIIPSSFNDLIALSTVRLPLFIFSAIFSALNSPFSFIHSKTSRFISESFTPPLTPPLTPPFTPPSLRFASFKEIFVLNTSPSINSGVVPEYTLLYLTMFLTPEPSSYAQPISLTTEAITGFFGYGTKSVRLIVPSPRALLPFSVLTQSFSIINFAG